MKNKFTSEGLDGITVNASRKIPSPFTCGDCKWFQNTCIHIGALACLENCIHDEMKFEKKWPEKVELPFDVAIELLEYFEDIYDPTPIENNGPPEMQNEAYWIQELKKATGEK